MVRDADLYIDIEGAPNMPGLRFRRWAGSGDFPRMSEVANKSWETDLVDAILTPEDLKDDFEHVVNFDSGKDVVLAEIAGTIAGFGRVTWTQKLNDLVAYRPYVVLLPEHRGHGIRRTLLRFCEGRARELSQSRPKEARKVMEMWTASAPNSWKSLLESEGYAPSWYLLEMVRENLDRIPDPPLPPGIEVRPVRTEDLRKIWDSAKEALRDELNFEEEKWSDDAFEHLPSDRLFNPALWQIAWEGDEVVGGVHNVIDPEENEGLGRKWGHTEQIFVRRKWRGKGIAKALIARSLRVVRDSGMEAATLDVDAQNPSRAVKLYEGLGYRKCRDFTFYRKPL